MAAFLQRCRNGKLVGAEPALAKLASRDIEMRFEIEELAGHGREIMTPLGIEEPRKGIRTKDESASWAGASFLQVGALSLSECECARAAFGVCLDKGQASERFCQGNPFFVWWTKL